MTSALASWKQLAAFMEVPATASPAGELLLEAATSTIRRYCGWHVFPKLIDHEIIVDAHGGAMLALPTLNLLELSAVAVKQAGSSQWLELTAEELDALDYSRDGWLRAHRGVWPCRPRSVRVTMTHGFDDVPEVQQLALTMAARALAVPTGAVSASMGAVSLNFGAGGEGGPGGGVRLWNDQRDILDRYRIFGRA